ncbi:hypothetical protein [Dongia deserti]|uniref:hypothetical protein n=1 Tax=Dongia deserti TaxID=2268030 RepID=UPI000E64C0B4|nr:hypothetical protein [Dongia deserti]
MKHNNVVQHESAGTPIGDKFAWMDRVMAKAIGEADGLTDFEVDFATNTATRLGRYGERTLFTPKQMAVAHRIGRKLEVEL